MRKKKLKNKILLAITYVAGFNLMFWVCAVDSESYIPYVGILISFAWLIPFGIANHWGNDYFAED